MSIWDEMARIASEPGEPGFEPPMSVGEMRREAFRELRETLGREPTKFETMTMGPAESELRARYERGMRKARREALRKVREVEPWAGGSRDKRTSTKKVAGRVFVAIHVEPGHYDFFEGTEEEAILGIAEPIGSAVRGMRGGPWRLRDWEGDLGMVVSPVGEGFKTAIASWLGAEGVRV